MKRVIETDKAPAPIGAYSQAVRAENLVFLSGQIPLTPDGESLIDQPFPEQVKQIFRNLEAVTKAAGGGLNDIIKLTVYLTDLNQFESVNKVMMELLEKPYPARAAVEVSRLPKDFSVEIEGVMVLSSA